MLWVVEDHHSVSYKLGKFVYTGSAFIVHSLSIQILYDYVVKSAMRTRRVVLQPRKYQLSNSQVPNISKSVVKDMKLPVHNSHPGAI